MARDHISDATRVRDRANGNPIPNSPPQSARSSFASPRVYAPTPRNVSGHASGSGSIIIVDGRTYIDEAFVRQMIAVTLCHV